MRFGVGGDFGTMDGPGEIGRIDQGTACLPARTGHQRDPIEVDNYIAVVVRIHAVQYNASCGGEPQSQEGGCRPDFLTKKDYGDCRRLRRFCRLIKMIWALRWHSRRYNRQSFTALRMRNCLRSESSKPFAENYFGEFKGRL
jgi:hypothetical protein